MLAFNKQKTRRITEFFNKVTKPASLQPGSPETTLKKNTSIAFSDPKSVLLPLAWTKTGSHDRGEGSSQHPKDRENIANPDSQYPSVASQTGKGSTGELSPQVKKLVSRISDIKDSKDDRGELLISNPLTGSEYRELLEYIEESPDDELRTYFNDELRYDYTRSKQTFVIRMPSYIHDTVAENIGVLIGSWLQGLKKSPNNDIAKVAKQVAPAGSSSIEFRLAKGKPDQKSADKIFQHTSCKFPGLVVEVARSQSEKELEERAISFITRSKGEVRTVVGINLHRLYLAERNKQSTQAPALFSVWKAVFDDRRGKVTPRSVILNQAFRDGGGKPVIGEDGNPIALQLSLKEDFICRKVADSITDSDCPMPLELSSRDLCEYYELGVALYRGSRPLADDPQEDKSLGDEIQEANLGNNRPEDDVPEEYPSVPDETEAKSSSSALEERPARKRKSLVEWVLHPRRSARLQNKDPELGAL